MSHESYESFDQVKARLDEIVEAVGSDEMPLDEALSLYEEAVGLGLRASELLETNIEERDAQEADENEAAEQAEASLDAADENQDAEAVAPTAI